MAYQFLRLNTKKDSKIMRAFPILLPVTLKEVRIHKQCRSLRKREKQYQVIDKFFSLQMM
uniref:Uncharacterized protein n=1 Tax=Rhizophora mucronata TaxID=61149 RepID=A0A2P2LNT7_RHIMU